MLIERHGFVFQHHGDAVAEGEPKPVGVTDQHVALRRALQRAFADGADQEFNEAGVHVVQV